MAPKRKPDRDAFLALYPELEADLATNHRIVNDIRARFAQWPRLSPAQVALVQKLAGEARAQANKPPEAHVPAPTGRQTFVGTIVAVKIGDFGPRWTVKVDVAGGSWLANGSVPSTILDAIDRPVGGYNQLQLRGLDVEITATLVPGDRDAFLVRDAHFAFAKRPIAKILATCHPDCSTHALRAACRARRGVPAPLPQIDAVRALAECWPAWTVEDTLRVLAERKAPCDAACRGFFYNHEKDAIERCDECASLNGYATRVYDEDIAAAVPGYLKKARAAERRAERKRKAPPCVRAMGCLCAGHATRLDASAPCDAHEGARS